MNGCLLSIILSGLLGLYCSAATSEALPVNQQQLDNGLHIIHHYRPYADTVTLQMVVEVGLADFQCDRQQIPHILEHMLLSKTQRFPEGAARKTIKDLGGTTRGYTKSEYTHFSVTLHSDLVSTGLDILHSIIFEADLSSSTLHKSITAVHSELGTSDNPLKNLINDTPAVVDLGIARLYANSNLDCTTQSSPENTSLSDIESAYARFYHPSNMTLIIVGNLHWEDLTQHYLTPFNVNTSRVETESRIIITPHTIDASPIIENDTFSESKVHVNLLLPASGKSSGKGSSYALISDFLGEKLFYDLRSGLGIVYSPRAKYIAGSDLGHIHATTETTPEWESTVTQRFLNHYNTLYVEGIPAQDVARLKRKAILRYESKERKNIDIAQQIRHHRRNVKSQGAMPDIVAEIESITPSSIRQLIQTQLPAHPILATLHPLNNHQLFFRILLIIAISALIALPLLRRARKNSAV